MNKCMTEAVLMGLVCAGESVQSIGAVPGHVTLNRVQGACHQWNSVQPTVMKL